MWKPERRELFDDLLSLLLKSETFTADNVKQIVEKFIESNELGFGDVLPILRIGISGTTKGPDVFAMLALLGKEEVEQRMVKAFDLFNNFVAAK
jgi:glutamyl-tRNA synthetase